MLSRSLPKPSLRLSIRPEQQPAREHEKTREDSIVEVPISLALIEKIAELPRNICMTLTRLAMAGGPWAAPLLQAASGNHVAAFLRIGG